MSGEINSNTSRCFCSNCGNEIEQGGRFCAKCGTPVYNPGVETATMVNTVNEVVKEKKVSKKSGKKKVWIPILIVACLVLIVGFVSTFFINFDLDGTYYVIKYNGDEDGNEIVKCYVNKVDADEDDIKNKVRFGFFEYALDEIYTGDKVEKLKIKTNARIYVNSPDIKEINTPYSWVEIETDADQLKEIKCRFFILKADCPKLSQIESESSILLNGYDLPKLKKLIYEPYLGDALNIRNLLSGTNINYDNGYIQNLESVEILLAEEDYTEAMENESYYERELKNRGIEVIFSVK